MPVHYKTTVDIGTEVRRHDEYDWKEGEVTAFDADTITVTFDDDTDDIISHANFLNMYAILLNSPDVTVDP